MSDYEGVGQRQIRHLVSKYFARYPNIIGFQNSFLNSSFVINKKKWGHVSEIELLAWSISRTSALPQIARGGHL